MRVIIRLFAMQRELLGWKQRPLELAAGSSVEDAWGALVSEYPVLASSAASVRFARNGVYADRSESLADGDELVLIPPVAGGSGPARRIELWEEPFPDHLSVELGRALATTADGAVVTFEGRTRETPGTPAPGEEVPAAVVGQRVEGLEYEAFEPMALAVLGAIADEIGERFGVDRLAILHRTGTVPLGEPSVLIVTASQHRGAAFDACRYAIEELKARVPIWKQERYRDGSVWIGSPARHGASGPAGAEPAADEGAE
jgi:molybdopterin synthase catalytic subunit/molybdopterin converting factor small subunit